MRRIFLVAFLASLCLAAGFTLSAGGEGSTPKPAYTNFADTWKDPSSGLTWQVSPSGDRMDLPEAQLHCQNLSLAGHNDWRLPTISELRSIIRGCSKTETRGSCGVTDNCLSIRCRKDCRECLNYEGPGSGGAYWPSELSGKVNAYWSSSKIADRDKVWYVVGFVSGGILNGSISEKASRAFIKRHGIFVRCVR